MAKGQEIKIGPWPDGINQLDLPDQIRDSQLVNAINFDVDNTGVLRPRRGLRHFLSASLVSATTLYLAGYVTLTGETVQKTVIGNWNGTTTSFAAWIINGTSTNLNTLTGRYFATVQYGGKIWYIPGESSAIGKSASLSPTIGSAVSVAAMPYGDAAFILKDRLFIVRKATSELYFSKATDFNTWAAPDGGVIQINPGDNQPITKVVTLNNQIIIFKRDQTFVFSFTNSPTGDGSLRQVSADQGAWDAVTYNNEIYCFNSRSVFKFVNGYFQDIGLQLGFSGKANLDSVTDIPARLHVIGKTLLLAFSDLNVSSSLAMNLDTGAWSTYIFNTTHNLNGPSLLVRSATTANSTLVVFGGGTAELSYMEVARSATRVTDEKIDRTFWTPVYQVSTKTYSFDDEQSWKRLYSWNITGVFGPGVSTKAAYAYAGTDSVGTSAYVFSSSDTKDLIGGGSIQSTRFRSVRFKIETTGEASTVSADAGPAIYNIKAVVGVKSPVNT